MRILFVSLIDATWGGSEVLWSLAAEKLAAQGANIAVFFPYYKMPTAARRLAEAGVRLEFGTPPPTRWWRRWTLPAKSPAERFEGLLHSFRPDLVVFNQGDASDGMARMSACSRLKVPFAILNQATGPLFHPDATWHEMRRHFSAARRVWFVSEENRLDLQTCLAVPLPQTEVIANAYGCAYDPPDSWPQGESPANPPLRLALVSRLEIRQKGQDLLFTSLARPEWRKRPLHVTLFGGGPNEAALRARAQNLGLLNVHFAGHADDISSVWKTHHALLLPSRFEGQSLAMIEAMLHARPVIAMPVGGVGGVVIDGRTGFVASAVTESAWNEAMERAWLRRTEWPAIGREARAHIKNIVGPDPGRALAEQIRKIADAPR